MGGPADDEMSKALRAELQKLVAQAGDLRAPDTGATTVTQKRTLQAWTHFQCLRLGNLLYTELSQVMVDVFVHENRPLLWVERTKERMWVL